jgi:hypothetical protein
VLPDREPEAVDDAPPPPPPPPPPAPRLGDVEEDAVREPLAETLREGDGEWEVEGVAEAEGLVPLPLAAPGDAVGAPPLPVIKAETEGLGVEERAVEGVGASGVDVAEREPSAVTLRSGERETEALPERGFEGAAVADTEGLGVEVAQRLPLRVGGPVGERVGEPPSLRVTLDDAQLLPLGVTEPLGDSVGVGGGVGEGEAHTVADADALTVALTVDVV